MNVVVVLFNLRAGVSVEAYEKFARTMDIPEVNRLPSVEKFAVLKAQGLMNGGASPYQYIEILQVRDMQQLGKDTQSEVMKKVVATFAEMVDAPQFIVTQSL